MGVRERANKKQGDALGEFLHGIAEGVRNILSSGVNLDSDAVQNGRAALSEAQA